MKLNNTFKLLAIFQIILSTIFYSCKKLVEISPPVNTITTTKVFSTDQQATSAVLGIYAKMINIEGIGVFAGGTTIYPGMSADELISTRGPGYQPWYDFNVNTLKQDNSELGTFWDFPYSMIYSANSVIEGLMSSIGVSDSAKKELTGEAKFIRGLCYFYLINLFGDVPLVTTIDYHKTALLSRTSSAEVYNQIISDLKDARDLLPDDYSGSWQEKIRANKWAATSLLARVYLYMGDWVNAESLSNTIISNSNKFDLQTNLGNVFLNNSNEIIFQLKRNNQIGQIYNATTEGYNLVPNDPFSGPNNFYLSSNLVNAFEPSDQRKMFWVDSIMYNGAIFYYPFKYTIGPANAFAVAQSQYYVIFRLAEQYLIRAEARAKQNNLSGAISDLNVIRNRAGLPNLTSSLTPVQVMAAIEQERRIELFAEWGHRWLDLKRWGKTDAVLGPIKGSNWQTTDKLYPIPLSELIADPNLTQNPGY